jgi:hypothetical protein
MDRFHAVTGDPEFVLGSGGWWTHGLPYNGSVRYCYFPVGTDKNWQGTGSFITKHYRSKGYFSGGDGWYSCAQVYTRLINETLLFNISRHHSEGEARERAREMIAERYDPSEQEISEQVARIVLFGEVAQEEKR